MANAPSRFAPAPMDPDEFSSGRPDAFIGTVLGTYAFPYKGKNSSDGRYYLNVAFVIQPDADTGYTLFTEAYNAGFLNACVPSKDNIHPAGADDGDYTDLSNGKGELEKPVLDDSYNVLPDSPYVGTYVMGSFAKGRSWEQVCRALRDADTKGLIDWASNKPGYVGFANGLKCRFDRVPQTSSGKAPAAPKEGQREFKVLVPTEVLGRVEAGTGGSAGKGKSAGSAAASNTPAGSGGAGGDFDAAIKAAILTFLATQPDNKALVGVISTKVSSEMKKAGFDKVESMGWILETRTPTDTFKVHLADIDGTSYDPEAQTLELE